MKLLLPAVLLLAACAPRAGADEPKPGALTPEEIAGGWVRLFDGRDSSELLIDGEYRLDDGALVIGGIDPARLFIRRQLGDDFELRLSCRGEGTGMLQLHAESHRFGGGSSFGMGFPASPPQPGAAPEWRELRCRCQPDAGAGGYRLVVENRREGEAAAPGVANSSYLSGSSPPGVWLEVPAGTQLLLRDMRARPDPTAGRWWRGPWGFGAVLLAAFLALVVAVLLFVRRMRRRPADPASGGRQPPVEGEPIGG
jgi:hypothetical protein